tara:strand:- start:94384 stop:94485 length:102 start_codon:yes stop_codon:yes gene_type:complete
MNLIIGRWVPIVIGMRFGTCLPEARQAGLGFGI